MSSPDAVHPAPLLAALRDVVGWFESTTVHGIVIGGIASSLLGRPRTTADVDGLVIADEGDFERLFATAKTHRLAPRIGDALAFARRSRVMLLKHEPTGIAVDVTAGLLPFERRAVERAIRIPHADLVIPLPRPEDLLVMKAVAHRPRDLADIEGLLEAQQDVDLAEARKTVREFAEMLEMPEIATSFEEVIRRVRGPPREK